MSKVELDIKNELVELDKKHFIHPTSNLMQLQEEGTAFIFTEGDGIYLKDVEGRKLMDRLSSLWNVNIGRGRKELGEVAIEQMNNIVSISTFNLMSDAPHSRLSSEVVCV